MIGVYELRISVAFMSCAQEMNALRMISVVIGSARRHSHDLVLGNYSIHTSVDALARGEAEIMRVGRELRANGTLKR